MDGVTHPVPAPFTVIATENPVGAAGTQMLPQSQLNRFTVCVVMGYPDTEAEMQMLAGRGQRTPAGTGAPRGQPGRPAGHAKKRWRECLSMS